MKKAAVAAVLTAALVILSFVNASCLRKIEQSIKEQTDLTMLYIDKENYSAARAELNKGFELWQSADRYTGVLLTDETVSSITDAFFAVFLELAEQNKDTASSELEHLTFKLHSMAEAERIAWKNIF